MLVEVLDPRVAVAEGAVGVDAAPAVAGAVAAAQREPGAREQGLGAQRRLLGRAGDRRVQPAGSLGEVVAVQPEAPEARRQAQRRLRVGAQREGERGAQVVVLGLERAQRPVGPGLDGVVALGEGQAPVEVAAGPGGRARPTPRGARPRTGGSSRAGAGARVLGDDERLVDQAGRETGHAPALDRAAGAHVLGGVERRTPPANTARRRKSSALLAVEQVVAPVDRRAQRLLARSSAVAAAVAEHVERVVQARRDLLERERAARARRRARCASGMPSSRRQISATTRRCSRRARAGEPGARAERGALGEQRASAPRRRARGHAPRDLAGDAQRLAARRQHPQPRARRASSAVDQVGAGARRGARSCRARAASRAGARRAASASSTERWRGRGTPSAAAAAWATSVGSRDARELDEPHAVGRASPRRAADLEREARLADAAGPGEREQPGAARAAARPPPARARGRRSSVSRRAAGSARRGGAGPRSRGARGTARASLRVGIGLDSARSGRAAARTQRAPPGGGRRRRSSRISARWAASCERARRRPPAGAPTIAARRVALGQLRELHAAASRCSSRSATRRAAAHGSKRSSGSSSPA